MFCNLKRMLKGVCVVLCHLILQFRVSAAHLCSKDESIALLGFKSVFSINRYSNGFAADSCDRKTSRPKTNSWEQGTDCCSWDGVLCDTANGQVIGLDLTCSWLRGSIRSNNSLFLLRRLKYLDLSFNDFMNSKISPEFGRFESLTHLNLANSVFLSEVPIEISFLSNLISLDLTSDVNLLTLEPHTLETIVRNLSSIEQLVLDTVDMYSIAGNSLSNISSSLTHLRIYECGLHGLLPHNILLLPKLNTIFLSSEYDLTVRLPKSNWTTSLEHITLLRVSSFGPLPESIGELKYLKELTITRSSLVGAIPTSINKLTQLTTLSLKNNKLVGSIPNLSNASKLFELDLSNNSLSGSVPSWIYTHTSLRRLSLYDNQLGGSVNEFHKSFEQIDLRNNKLEGLIPSSIFHLVNLTYLDLSSNVFNGSVDFDISNLRNLGYLDLSYNSRVSLTMNTNVTTLLPHLQVLLLSACNINEFPNFLRGLKSLEQLDLSNNNLHGRVPRWFFNVGKESMYLLNLSYNYLTLIEKLPWKTIGIIDMRSNLLQGSLPTPPPTIMLFMMSTNNLTGQMPISICEASFLEVLDLSKNRLDGTIPTCIGNSSTESLSVIDLRSNELRGVIPDTFLKGSVLRTLNLNGNKLEGVLPPSVVRCKMLQVFDVGNNFINDTFPYWLQTLPELQVLVLGSNNLQGSIHNCNSSSKHCFPKLRLFDISNNNFVGPLPPDLIDNFKSMMEKANGTDGLQYIGEEFNPYQDSVVVIVKGFSYELVKILTTFTSIDFSNNKLEGQIPETIGKLVALRGLNFSHNLFKSGIPISMRSLRRLEWLDLSSNKLQGEIPIQLVELTSLAILNLSNNQLVGQIPQGNQFNTFSNESFKGNLGLCGFPLSNPCNEGEKRERKEIDQGEAEYGWQFVLVGYVSGFVVGMGIFVLRNKDPEKRLWDLICFR